jgi:hypothetical protein
MHERAWIWISGLIIGLVAILSLIMYMIPAVRCLDERVGPSPTSSVSTSVPYQSFTLEEENGNAVVHDLPSGARC